MPRKVIKLPVDRTEWHFGHVVAWHFFVYGTRPEANPGDRIGRLWSPKEATDALGLSSIRSLWNWVDASHLPYDTTALERALFGKSTLFDAWRLELQRALRETRERNANRRATTEAVYLPEKPSRDVVVYETQYEDDEPEVIDADFEEIPPARAEKFGKSDENPFQRGPLRPVLPPRSGKAERTSSPPRPPQSSRKTVVALFAGLLLLLGGYGVKRYMDYSKETPGPVTANQDQPKPPSPEQKPPTVDVAVKPPASDPEAERRAAEAKRREEQRLAAEKTAMDAAARQRAAQEDAARDLNAKLRAMAQAEVDTCQQVLQGLSVPGFTLKCDTLIPFGALLGSVPVSQTAASLGDCAARCRKAPKCVAFSFDAGAHEGAASCYLTGSIPSVNKAKNWISGTRQ